jgi:DNA-binding CsgD family transcriptional regulator
MDKIKKYLKLKRPNRPRVNPGKYNSKTEQNAVSEFMLLLRWSFNAEKGIWYKDGIKDENNIWVNLQNKPKKIKSKNTPKEQIADYQKQIAELVAQGKTFKSIGEQLNLNPSIVYKWHTLVSKAKINRRKYDVNEKKRIIQDIYIKQKEGMNWAEMEKYFQIPLSTLFSWKESYEKKQRKKRN